MDNSASMQTAIRTPVVTRLAEAIDRAGDVAAGLRQGDQIALITAGTSVRVVVGMTDFGAGDRRGVANDRANRWADQSRRSH